MTNLSGLSNSVNGTIKIAQIRQITLNKMDMLVYLVLHPIYNILNLIAL